MAALTIRSIDDSLKSRLRVRAAQHGRSMEEEARRILAQALQDAESPVQMLGTRLHKHFAGLGEVSIPPRSPTRPAPDFVARKAKKSESK